MSQFADITPITLKQGTAVTPCTIVKGGSADSTVIEATAATDEVLGVASEVSTDTANDPVGVYFAGVALVKASAAITRFSKVGATTGGEGVAVTSAGNRYVGYALEAATTAGDLIPVLIQPGIIHS